MRKKERVRPKPDDPRWLLAERITTFVNAVFQRRLRTSRALYDAIEAALDAGYTEDEVRIAFWVARCIEGAYWLKEALSDDLSPEIALRFKGGTNPESGKEAKRWLDELTARVGEMNTGLVGRVLKQLPVSIAADEAALLERMGVDFKAKVAD